MHWLRGDDLNTKFFHMLVTTRKNFKKIEMLINEDQVEVKDQAGICEVAKNYFDNLFAAKDSVHEPVLSIIQPTISNADNDMLLPHVTKEELHDALIHMHPTKSPGPDDFNPAFYHKFWYMCGDDIFGKVTHWLERGFFPSSLNDTNICLIPKCVNPNNMKKLRHILLYNVVYKMVSKLIANRMKECMSMSKCVSEEQSDFVEG